MDVSAAAEGMPHGMAHRTGTRLLLRTRRFSVVDSESLIRGRKVRKPYISHNDCVEILAMTGSRVVLIKSYRPELNRYAYEIPSGTMRRGERPAAAARRELGEETGYYAKKIRHIFSGYPLLGYSDCKLHFFLATGLKKGAQRLENDESIFVEEMAVSKVLAMAKKGRIADLSVLTALDFCRLNDLP